MQIPSLWMCACWCQHGKGSTNPILYRLCVLSNRHRRRRCRQLREAKTPLGEQRQVYYDPLEQLKQQQNVTDYIITRNFICLLFGVKVRIYRIDANNNKQIR